MCEKYQSDTYSETNGVITNEVHGYPCLTDSVNKKKINRLNSFINESVSFKLVKLLWLTRKIKFYRIIMVNIINEVIRKSEKYM